MSTTNEKLQTIKDNVSKVYHSGQMDVIKNANSLKGFESSKAMLLDDVSPVEHEMNVKVRGKNILPPADSGIYYNGSISKGRPFIYDQNRRLTDFNNIDISSYRGVYAVIRLTEGETYTLTINNLVNNCETKQIKLAVGFRSSESTVFGTSEIDNVVSSLDYNSSSLTFTVPSGYPYCLVGFYNYPTTSGDTVSFNAMQLEYGTTATDYEPYNNDVQNVYSKNLIPYPYINSTQIINGVTFTVNSDGTITANGTATSNAYLGITSISTFYIPKGDYILSGCPSGGSSTTYSLVAVNATGASYTKFRQDIGDGITLSSSGEYWIIRCQVMAGQTVENIVFKPQIELGSTVTYYEKYHEPYPLVVKRCGKNLIPFPYRDLKLGTSTYNGVDFTVYEDGSILINGTATSNTTRYLYHNLTDLLGLKSGITISGSKNASDDTQQANVYFVCNYYDSAAKMQAGIQASYNASGKTTITDDWKGLGIYLHIPKGKTFNNLLIKPQLEIGTTTTEYEPYITPTEYTPTTDGVINGIKNLYPNTTLISNGDRVYIDCNYYKDIDKAYNKLSAEIALSGGE